MQLTALAKRKPHELSGGQQQRVALARALVLEPRVLLLDEPLGALDAQLRKALQRELSALHREVGITFVYVTHDQEEALTMSDRVAVMNHGRIEQCARPRDIYERPDHPVRRQLPRGGEPPAGRPPRRWAASTSAAGTCRARPRRHSSSTGRATWWSGPSGCGWRRPAAARRPASPAR